MNGAKGRGDGLMPDIDAYNRQIISEFRARRGAGGQLQGLSLLLLHHRSVRGGRRGGPGRR